MRKLYLHIGSGKTGTTSIQKFLSENRKLLSQQNFCYPGGLANHHQIVTVFESDAKVLPREFAIVDKAKLREASASYSESIMNEIKKSKQDFIISTEYFQNITKLRNVKKVHHFFSEHFDKIEVIFFVREPVGLYQSLVQQFVKAASVFPGPGLEFNFRSTIEAWRSYFPVTVRAFDPGEDVVGTFCEATGIDASSFYKVSDRNQSLSMEQVFLLCKIQHFLYGERENIFKPHLKIISDNPPPKSLFNKPTVKNSVRALLWESNIDDYKWLNKKYCTNFELPAGDEKIFKKLRTLTGNFENLPSIFEVDYETSAKYEAMVVNDLLLLLQKKSNPVV